MQIILRFKNFILYLLFFTLITAGLYTVPSSASVMDVQEQTSSVVLRASGLSMPDECLPERLVRRSTSSIISSVARSSRSTASHRFMLLFFTCILTLMSFLANLAIHLIAFHDSRYVYEKDFIVSFIHDTDGRKQISYPFLNIQNIRKEDKKLWKSVLDFGLLSL